MQANRRFNKWWALPIFLITIVCSGHVHAVTFTSTQSGSWGSSATWGGAGVPGAGDNVIISNGNTVTEDGNRTCADLSVNGTLDMTNNLLFFQGTTFTNNGSIIGNPGGQFFFNGVAGAGGTMQAMAGAGTYDLTKPVDLHITATTTVTPASGTVIDGVHNFIIDNGGTLSLSNTLVVNNGTTINNSGLISGAGILQTQGPVTVNTNSTTAPFEAVSGTTMGSGVLGKMTIDSGATFQQNGNLTANGDLTVAGGGMLDMHNQLLFFQGTTFTNNGSIIGNPGGQFFFNGVAGAGGTMQAMAGAGTYDLTKPVDLHITATTTVTPASGTVIDGVHNFIIDNGGTLSLSNTLVVNNGTTINNSGLISGAGILQTQGPVTVNTNSTTAPFEAVSGTTMGSGVLGKMTIDSGATFQQNGNLTANGDLTVAGGGMLDMHNQLLFFQGTTFTNNGSIIGNPGGQFFFNGVAGAGGTTQHVAASAGSFDATSTAEHIANTTTVVQDGNLSLSAITIDSGSTLRNLGTGPLTLSGNVANSGTILFNGGGAACGDATKILIRSSVMGVQRPWAGGGTFLMTDLDVRDQAGSAAITVTGGVDSGNNASNWSFANCATGTPTPTPTATPTATPSKLLNIATRMRVQTGDNALIGGFIVTGTDPKRVIIRGIGPSLAQFFSGALVDPTLELYQGSTLLVMNDNWKTDQQAEIEATGIPPTKDLESAIVRTLTPGSYTAILRGKGNTTGIGVVEAYDLDQAANSKLANISTRGFVETGDNVMIGGLIIGPTGGASVTVVVRAIGPSLSNFGISGALQDPTLDLVNSDGVVMRSNNDWRDSQQSQIIATGLQPSDDRESALVETLSPGNYTAIVRGVGNTTGVALVEAYHLQ